MRSSASDVLASLMAAQESEDRSTIFKIAGQQKRRRDYIVARDSTNERVNRALESAESSAREARRLDRVSRRLSEIGDHDEASKRIREADHARRSYAMSIQTARHESKKADAMTKQIGSLPQGNRKIRRAAERAAAKMRGAKQPR